MSRRQSCGGGRLGVPGGREGIVLRELAQVEMVLLVSGISQDALDDVAVVALGLDLAFRALKALRLQVSV